MNGSVVPLKIVALAGVTAIDTSAAGATVTTAWPVMLPSVALIREVPRANPTARPEAEMLATEGVADAQDTWLVKSRVELSEKVPVAVSC